MRVNREAVANALLALFTPLSPGTFATVSRAAKIWSQVEGADQPALFLVETGETITEPDGFGLNKYVLHYNLLVYARADAAGGAIAATMLNAIRDAIDNALETVPPGEAVTLGGLITNVSIEGEVLVDTGILDQQCALVIPIRAITGI